MTKLRVVVLSLLLAVPFCVLEARLFWMQVLNAEEYRSRADWTRGWVEVVPTPRGQVRDRNGEVLASEERCFDVELVLADFELPRQKGREPDLDYQKLAAVLRAVAGLTGVEAEAVYAKGRKILSQVETAITKRTTVPGKPAGVREARLIRRQEWRQPYRLWTGLTFDQAAEVALDDVRFTGLEIRERTRRTYPAGRTACHICGYVGLLDAARYDEREKSGKFRGEMGLSIDAAELERQRAAGWFREDMAGRLTLEEYERLEFRGAFFGDWVGRDGIERVYDNDLSGRRGLERREKHLLSKREWLRERVAPGAGRDIVLALDLRLQRRAEELLAALPPGADGRPLNGSIVVMDVNTGEVLVLASHPGFDLNLFKPPVPAATYDALRNAPEAPLLHRAVAGQFPMGSIFKVVTGAAALEKGVVAPDDLLPCNGRYDPEHFPNHFACWINARGGAHGELTIRDAMARSCNCYFFEAGKRAGIDDIARMADLFGLGRKSGIDLPGEEGGLMPTPAWRRARGGGRWGTAHTLNVSIGQGEIQATPLQAARLMAGVATGRLPVPRLRLDAPAKFEELPLKPETLRALRNGLETVCMETYGTGHAAQLHLFKAAGKTSTAQSSSRALGLEHHGWFAGYAPFDDPRYAFCVMIEHGGAGSGLSAQTAARLLHAFFPEVPWTDPLDPAGPAVAPPDAAETGEDAE